MTELTLDEWSLTVWQALQASGEVELNTLAAHLGADQSKVLVVAQAGAEQGYINVAESHYEEFVPSAEAPQLVAAGLPERRALTLLAEAGGQLATGDFAKAAGQAKIAVNEVFKWGTARGWIERDKAGIKLSPSGTEIANSGTLDVDEALILSAAGQPVNLDAQPESARLKELLSKRTELGKVKTRTRRVVKLTSRGVEVCGTATVTVTRNLMQPSDLLDGAWKTVTYRPYDVTLPAETVRPAKVHPLRKIMEQTRRAYLEMGFTEVVSPMVESSFWNFDALFQPQDHPARDMQDTFYMADPHTAPLPQDVALVDRVRRAHEDGGDTGSEGWGYKWSPERAQQIVLRTHTTASTIRALAAHPDPPFKAFCIGWVCRNETMSYKHLPVFHQVDGIVIDEHASLASLLGTLETFYLKMGFSAVKFKPAFYPYTEPSVDVVVYMESRGKWIEMGGAGIFRPEVTEPIGCKHPVLAWGLGMERLAMIRYSLKDIRELYQGRIEALHAMPLHQ